MNPHIDFETQIEKFINSFFVDILPEAYYGFNWNYNSVNSAVALAKSIERWYEKYSEHAEQRAFDIILHSLSTKGKSHSLQSFCAKDMKNASSLLFQALLENPSVGRNKLVTALGGSLDLTEEFKKQAERNAVCTELIEALKPLNITDSKRSLYHEIKAELYLDYLKNSIEHLPSKELIEEFLSSMLEQLCNRDQETFINVLMFKVSDTSSYFEIQEFSVNWTIFKLLSEKQSSFAEFMWAQYSKLNMISENSPFFHTFYLNFLTRCSSSLVFNNSEMKWIPMFSENELVLQFDEILNHFRCLLQTSGNVQTKTYDHLVNLLNSQPHEVVWKDIFARVT